MSSVGFKIRKGLVASLFELENNRIFQKNGDC